MIRGKRISLVIPCRNEEKALARLLKRVPKSVDEVVVIDNGSSDGTVKVAGEFGAVVAEEGRVDRLGIGYGYAHMKGMEKATGDYVVTMDGDGSYPVREIEDVVNKAIEENLDFVLCSRFPLKNKRAISWVRKLGVAILNLEVSVLYWRHIRDVLSGMWVVEKSFAKKLKLSEGGWDFSPEIKLAALGDRGARVGQYHVRHKYRSGGQSKQVLWQTGLNHFWYILKRRLGRDNPLRRWTGVKAKGWVVGLKELAAGEAK